MDFAELQVSSYTLLKRLSPRGLRLAVLQEAQMRVAEQDLQELRRRTLQGVQKAEALGDPKEIEHAKELDNLAVELIKRNGRLTTGDMVHLGILIDRLGPDSDDIAA